MAIQNDSLVLGLLATVQSTC